MTHRLLWTVVRRLKADLATDASPPFDGKDDGASTLPESVWAKVHAMCETHSAKKKASCVTQTRRLARLLFSSAHTRRWDDDALRLPCSMRRATLRDSESDGAHEWIVFDPECMRASRADDQAACFRLVHEYSADHPSDARLCIDLAALTWTRLHALLSECSYETVLAGTLVFSSIPAHVRCVRIVRPRAMAGSSLVVRAASHLVSQKLHARMEWTNEDAAVSP